MTEQWNHYLRVFFAQKLDEYLTRFEEETEEELSRLDPKHVAAARRYLQEGGNHDYH